MSASCLRACVQHWSKTGSRRRGPTLGVGELGGPICWLQFAGADLGADPGGRPWLQFVGVPGADPGSNLLADPAGSSGGALKSVGELGACQLGPPNMLANRRVSLSRPLKMRGLSFCMYLYNKKHRCFGTRKSQITKTSELLVPSKYGLRNFRTVSAQKLRITKNRAFDHHSGEGWLRNVR